MALAPLPVAIPLLVAAFLAATGGLVPARAANWIAIATATVTAVMCGFLYSWSGSEQLVYWFGAWQPRHGVALGISFVIDRAGAGMGTLAAVLVIAGLSFSSKFFDVVHALYQVLMLAFLGAMCGFSLTGDLFNMFVFFELMSAAAFALCGYRTEDPGPLQGAVSFAITNTIGAFLALSGIGLLYGRTGALNMAQIGRTLGPHADALVVVSFLLIMTGFFVKAAIVPFHFWLADAHAVAPTPVCVLFSGVMVELGLYAVARVYWTIFAGPLGPYSSGLREVLLGAGVATALLGGIMCFAQRHLKRLLAYSTISHTGLMLMGFALLDAGALAGTGVYVLGHAMLKSALFLCSGILLHRFATVDEIELRGCDWRRDRALAVTATVWVLAGLGLAGLPPFGTFLGDALIGDSLEHMGLGWLSAIIVAVEVLTGGAVLRAAGRIFLGWGADVQPGEKLEEEPETQGGHDRVPVLMVVPAVVLLVLGVAIGLTPHLREAAISASMRFVDRPGYQARVLAGAIPMMPPAVASAPPGSALLRGFGATLGAVLLAFGALRGLRLRGRVDRWTIGLRRLHSGEVGDYVAWLTAGAATFGTLFIALFR